MSEQTSESSGGALERFTDGALAVMRRADEEARRLRHNYVGTEHLLLGLIHDSRAGAPILHSLGVKLSELRTDIEAIVGRGDRLVGAARGLTPRAQRALRLAIDEARELEHDRVGTEHLLLGVLAEGQGIAAGLLARSGVRLDDARQTVLIALAAGLSHERLRWLRHQDEVLRLWCAQPEMREWCAAKGVDPEAVILCQPFLDAGTRRTWVNTIDLSLPATELLNRPTIRTIDGWPPVRTWPRSIAKAFNDAGLMGQGDEVK